MTVTLANAGAIDRSETDFYPTPAEVTEALMLFLRLPEGTTIWEPAAGEGHMARVMEKWGMRVSCSDLYTYTKENFLEVKESRGDWIITNPPFFASEDFIRHALGFKGGVAMLLKSQYWHAATRLNLFKKHTPSFVLPLAWRPDFLFGRKASAPTMEVLWTVWMPSRSVICEYRPLPRPLVGQEDLRFA